MRYAHGFDIATSGAMDCRNKSGNDTFKKSESYFPSFYLPDFSFEQKNFSFNVMIILFNQTAVA